MAFGLKGRDLFILFKEKFKRGKRIYGEHVAMERAQMGNGGGRPGNRVLISFEHGAGADENTAGNTGAKLPQETDAKMPQDTTGVELKNYRSEKIEKVPQQEAEKVPQQKAVRLAEKRKLRQPPPFFNKCRLGKSSAGILWVS